MINEDDYKFWWLENGLNEDIIKDSTFYDKGYAFFRNCMDSGMDKQVIINFVRFMIDNNITDSRDLNRDMWAKYLRQYRVTDKKEAYDLLHNEREMLYIPDLMDFIKRFHNIVLCGRELMNV